MEGSLFSQIGELKKQIEGLRQTLDLNHTATAEISSDFDEATKKLKILANMSDESSGVLHNLPNLLQSLLRKRFIGAMVIDSDGNLLLFNSAVEKIFGFDGKSHQKGQTFSDCSFFLGDRLSPCPVEQLPWIQAINGIEVQDMELFIKREDLRDGISVRVNATPLRTEQDAVGGAIAFIADLTEHLQVEAQVCSLAAALENQLSMIEKAHLELAQLSAKLKVGDVATEHSEAANLSTSAAGEAAVEKLAILVADDIPVNQKLLVLQLKKLGYETETVNDGLCALNAVKAKRYAMVLMDCDMPVMDGLAATRAIREVEKTTGLHVPIVALTSYDREGDRERCLEAGMDYYLNKGVGKNKLIEVVDLCLNNKLQEAGASAQPGEQRSFDPAAEISLNLDGLYQSYGAIEAQEILQLFSSSSSTLVNCIQFAIEDNDANAVNHFAYSLKGPCSSLRIDELARLTADITGDAEAGKWLEAKEKCGLLRSALEKVRVQINGVVDSAFASPFGS